ncbi:septal ring lytic transglycosylase RlpA family protein [Terriglobus tenax]|uniref:septal ring lytic transglycosylase RlpA family protein n=1 Tax=Terriglobus tenax TaxID=1111115 RepID=UPI00295BE9FB|nr:septal ring lytic transglycosylase RlpA family protein [Terriglobus tenax]
MQLETSSRLLNYIPRLVTGAVALALGFTASATSAAPADVPTDLPRDLSKMPDGGNTRKFTSKKPWYQIGKASWYGSDFQGKPTANGETFDMNSLTCAHRTLPLGSWARVTNLKTKKSIFVRVNDRGPMLEDRIVDLSYAAARKLGIGGLGKVRIDPVNGSNPAQVRALVAQTASVQPLLAR